FLLQILYKINNNTCFFQKFYSRSVFIILMIYYSCDSRLMNEFTTFFARRKCDIKCGSFTGLGRAGNFKDGICLSMKHIPFGVTHFVFTKVFKPGGSSVVAV